MKIAYAYEFDAADPMVQSGHPASILEQFQRLGTEVAPVFPLNRNARLLFAPKVARHRLCGRVYRPDREPRYLRSLARQVETRLQGVRPDVVFAPGSHAVARLKVDCPTVFCADATFANVLNTYDAFSRCALEFIAQGHAQERDALSRCAAAIFPSEWAARTAIEFYGADPARIHVVPFGANVDAPDSATVNDRIEHRDLSSPRVLFVGREWERKGADIVVAACDRLRSFRYDVNLDLVGLGKPPLPLPNWIRNHGFLDKRDPTKKRVLEDLFAHAHFLFVPSRAEAYGMVFCEAAAYGLPNLTSNVGGIPSIVRHGHSGYTLPPEAAAQTWARILADTMDDPEAYRRLARASRADYETRLNWAAFGHRLVDICATAARGPGR